MEISPAGIMDDEIHRLSNQDDNQVIIDEGEGDKRQSRNITKKILSIFVSLSTKIAAGITRLE